MTEQTGSIASVYEINLSIVIPFFNDEELVKPLYARLREVFGNEAKYEFILIDDGSSDQTFEKLQALGKEDRRFRSIRLNRNCGQRMAITVGMKEIRGQLAATMDPDLQNDPAHILELAGLMTSDTELVSGYREKRHESLFGRRFPSFITNRILSIVSGVSMKDFGCPMALFRVELVRETMRLSPSGLFSKTLASMLTKGIKELPLSHGMRSSGESSYNLWRLSKMFHFLVFSALELRLVILGLSPGAIRLSFIFMLLLNVLLILVSLSAMTSISFFFLMPLSLGLLLVISFGLSIRNNERLKNEACPLGKCVK